MIIKHWTPIDYLPIGLIALMILTRFHHFGDTLHLPDASLAVFFFAGFYRKKLLFVFLLALAGLIDYAAIANGTSDWCISPAYVFLIPTYAVMWFAGRYSAAMNSSQFVYFAKSAGLLMLATSAAFAISNGSFYLFSGRYEDLSLGQYLAATLHYYPPYMNSVLMYAVSGYMLMKLFKCLPVSASRQA